MIIFSPQLGLNPKSILGGEVFDREVLLGVANRGVKVEILLPKGKPHDKNIKNWHVSYLSISRFPARIFNLLLIPYVFSIYHRIKFDIVYLHSPRNMFLPCIFFRLMNPNVRLVAKYHQFKETNFLFLSNLINNFWDHIICDSENVKKNIIKRYHVPGNKISVVHNGAPKYLKPHPKDKRLISKLNLKGNVIFLYMGLFISRKNPLLLIDLLKILKEDNKNVVVIFLGKGPLESQIINRAKALRLSNSIRILKPIYGDKKNAIHNLTDVFIFPSLDEGFALAPLEAMACAKPVIMAKGHSASEAVDDGKNGFLCEDDIGDWAEKASMLIENKNLRKKMGKYSLERVRKEFNWKYTVDIHLEVFSRLLQ